MSGEVIYGFKNGSFESHCVIGGRSTFSNPQGDMDGDDHPCQEESSVR